MIVFPRRAWSQETSKESWCQWVEFPSNCLWPSILNDLPRNFTDTSPGPFKPGAFTLAGQLKPEPYLVPIALANFDKPVSSTVYSAVIKQPIKISNFVKDTTNINEIKGVCDRIIILKLEDE